MLKKDASVLVIRSVVDCVICGVLSLFEFVVVWVVDGVVGHDIGVVAFRGSSVMAYSLSISWPKGGEVSTGVPNCDNANSVRSFNSAVIIIHTI